MSPELTHLKVKKPTFAKELLIIPIVPKDARLVGTIGCGTLYKHKERDHPWLNKLPVYKNKHHMQLGKEQQYNTVTDFCDFFFF